ncbi:MAG TPA: serpin family protein, partial [Bacteroidales bacterium]|nr:serpin family protein [Bacteroidales bacterium]
GADGATRDSIMNALRYYNLDLDQINNSYKDLTDKLMTVDQRVLMEIANSIWIEDRLRIKQAFIDNLEDYFDAEAYNFSVNDPDIVDTINGWIEDKTHGKIKDMLDNLSPDVAMLLINAIYFNGKWKYEFEKSNTSDMPFYPENGLRQDVPMMNQELSAKMTSTPEFIMLELPYGQGNYVMDIMLPAEGYHSSDIVPLLNSENWTGWLEQLYEANINLYMPRFNYDYKINLNDILSEMGMGIAFTGNADFSNIADQGLAISRVLHQTFIETNEEGTEAAAATVVEIIFTSTEPGGPVEIKLDRPFLYAIRESTTNTIVFMGKTGNPASE